jgi:peptide chain release factor 3
VPARTVPQVTIGITPSRSPSLLSADGSDYDREQFLSGAATPVLFTSAALNFGVNQLLDVLVELAPPPSGALDVGGARRDTESPFSAIVFKVQAGMDSAHRDRIAYARVCSGTFERGDVLTHAATGKPFVTKYAQSVFGQQRTTLDTAWPGDVIGLANAAVIQAKHCASGKRSGLPRAQHDLHLPADLRGRGAELHDKRII